MTPERLEFIKDRVIKDMVHDVRFKRIMDELVSEVERLQTESLKLRIRELDKELRSYDERGGLKMEDSKGRPATQIEVEMIGAIANLQDENRELRVRIQQLEASQKRLVEVAETVLEHFRIQAQYKMEELGIARISVEGKLIAAIARAKGEGK